jgi:hypothetical protein
VKVAALDEASLRHICANLRPQSEREIFACRWDSNRENLIRMLMTHCADLAWVGSLDAPVYAGGAVQVWPGVWQSWGFGTAEWNKVAIPVTKFIRRSMLPTLKKLGCHRLESKCIAGDEEVAKWMRLLGGHQEAVLRGYGRNGEDFILYTWNFN